jgi:hypothetical protein
MHYITLEEAMEQAGEEDYYWRRLTDNFYQKDLMPSTYLEMHNQHAGKLGRSIDTSYEIFFPEIDSSDNQLLGSGLASLSQALIAAKQQGWLSDETAMKLLFKFANEDIDINAERARIVSEQRRSTT